MVKDRVTEALELFNSGFHCSQAVFAAFSEDLGLSSKTALKIACPFGGGLGGYGKTCGALTGAMMVIGLKFGSSEVNDPETKKLSRDKTRALIETFERTHGTSNCNELVGFDRSNLSGAELMAKLPYFHTTCPKFLETVVSYLEEEL
jgi:C_GCAxxG_C_C family probable redox protein